MIINSLETKVFIDLKSKNLKGIKIKINKLTCFCNFKREAKGSLN